MIYLDIALSPQVLGKTVSGPLSFVLDSHGEETNPNMEPPDVFVAVTSPLDAAAVSAEEINLVPGNQIDNSF